MKKIITQREKSEGRMVHDLIQSMTRKEKELFRAYLKGAHFVHKLKEAK